MQKTTIIGNLGNDPEMRFTPNGESVTSFSVAVNRRWTGRDGQQNQETVWFRVSAWGKQAENCEKYLHKGKQVYVEGRLIFDRSTGGPRLWTAQDNTVRASFELHAAHVQFLAGGEPGARNGGNYQGQEGDSSINEDDIPF